MTLVPTISHATSAGDLVAPLPRFPAGSPAVVLAYDRMRRELEDDDELAEFCWFAREYPRCYRFHMDGAEFRLKSLHALMFSLSGDLVKRAIEATENTWELAASDLRVEQVYWDFESMLSEINVALDLLTRVVGPAFHLQAPANFNKFCKLSEQHPLVDAFRSAQKSWVSRLKDYRDCFMHYTPVDTLLMVRIRRYANGWQLRASLPTNPNVREILGFRFSRRTELFRYAIASYRRMVAFDKQVAAIVWSEYKAGRFPKRRDGLFFVGRRDR